MSTREELVAGLRELANWLETNPDVPARPARMRHYVLTRSAANDEDGIAKLREVARVAHLPVTIGSDEASCVREFSGGVEWEAMYLFKDRVARYDALTSYDGSVVPA